MSGSSVAASAKKIHHAVLKRDSGEWDSEWIDRNTFENRSHFIEVQSGRKPGRWSGQSE
jgi:hypothetical protein